MGQLRQQELGNGSQVQEGDLMPEEIINGLLQDVGESGGGSEWGAVVTVTIASGVASVGSSNRNIRLDAEGAPATDSLTQITGLEIGQDIRIRPASGGYITVTDGANLNLTGVDFNMNDSKDVMVLECTAAGVCDEISRSSND